jgi:hypothetical protein
MLAIGRKFITHVLPGIIKPLHILWNEMIGFVFISIAIIATPRVYKEFAGFSGEPDQLGRIALGLCFLIPMYGFGVSSFWKARKIKKT